MGYPNRNHIRHSKRICTGRKGDAKAGKHAEGHYGNLLKAEGVKADPKLTSVIDKKKFDWDEVVDQNTRNYRNDRGMLGIVATNVPPINVDIGLDSKVRMNADEDKISEQESEKKEVS